MIAFTRTSKVECYALISLKAAIKFHKAKNNITRILPYDAVFPCDLTCEQHSFVDLHKGYIIREKWEKGKRNECH